MPDLVQECPFGRKERWTLVIHCFFDDSGKESDPSNRIVVIAGYMAAGDSAWSFLTQLWGNLLLKHGVSWIHMKDLMPNQGEYKALNWDWTKKRAVLDEFIKAIKVSQLVGFGVALDADAWRAIPKAITQAEGNVQQFCFMRIMRLIADRMKIARPDDWISLYYDCDEGFTPSRFQKFIGLRKREPDVDHYFRSFSIAEPKSFLPLQAADLLAWEARRELLRKIGGYESRPEFNFIFEALPGEVPDYVSEFWTAEEIEEKVVKVFSKTGP